MIAMIGLVTVPAAAFAVPNPGIVVDGATVGSGSGANGQLVIGDKVSISGTWDASKANPVKGNTWVC